MGSGPVRLLIALIGLLVLALSGPTPAWPAEARVTGVSVKPTETGLTLIVGLTKAIRPKLFTMSLKKDTPRIVIDFIGASAGRLPAKIASPSPLARGVRIGRHKDKIRIVIDLTPGYRFSVDQFYDRKPGRYRLVLTAPSS